MLIDHPLLDVSSSVPGDATSPPKLWEDLIPWPRAQGIPNLSASI